MTKRKLHKSYCFAGKTASCSGYLRGDRLPCICGAEGSILKALAQVAVPPHVLFESKVPAKVILPMSA